MNPKFAYMKVSLQLGWFVAVMVAAVGCSRSAAYYLDRGNELAAHGNYADAVLQYRKALQKNPNFGEAQYRLALASLQKGDAVAAYAALTEAVRLTPANDAPKVKLADINLAAYLKDPNRSARFYQRVSDLSTDLLEKNPRSVDGLRLKGALALLDQNLPNALKYYRSAYQLAPGNVDVAEGLVQSLIQSGQAAEGEHLAVTFLGTNPKTEPVYDILYTFYASMNRPADAESLLKRKIQNNPDKPQYRLQLAQHYARFNQTAEMNATLAGLLEEKNFPLAHLYVGDFYTSVGNRQEALRQFEQGAQSDTKNKATYQKRIGDLLLAQGKRDEAAKVIESILHDQPKDADALRVRAEIWMESGRQEDRSRAMLEFQQLAAANPTDAAVRFDLGRAYLLLQDTKAAQNAWRLAASLSPTFVQPRYALAELNMGQGHFQEALRRSEEVLVLQKEDPRAEFLRGAALTGLGRYEEARSALNRLALQYPESIDVQLQLGILDLREGKIRDAEARFQKAKPAAHSDFRPVMALAETYTAQKQFDTALELLQQQWKQSPDSGVVGNLAALTAVRAGKYDVAIEAYRRLLARTPQSAPLYRALAEAYLAIGRNADAGAAAQQGHQLDPNDPHLEVLLASASRLSGRGAEIRKNLEHALQLDPDNPVILNNLAFWLAEEGGDLDRALRLAEHAVQKVREEPSFTDTLGWVYLKKNMVDAALQVFVGLSQKYPDNSSFRYHLGATLAAKGDSSKARAALEQALSLGPDKADERKIRDLLDRLL